MENGKQGPSCNAAALVRWLPANRRCMAKLLCITCHSESWINSSTQDCNRTPECSQEFSYMWTIRQRLQFPDSNQTAGLCYWGIVPEGMRRAPTPQNKMQGMEVFTTQAILISCKRNWIVKAYFKVSRTGCWWSLSIHDSFTVLLHRETRAKKRWCE